MVAYFNGEIKPLASIAVSPEDRGFLFADGVYEVIYAYKGELLPAGRPFFPAGAEPFGIAHRPARYGEAPGCKRYPDGRKPPPRR